MKSKNVNFRAVILISLSLLLAGCAASQRAEKAGGRLHQVGLVWLKHAGSAEDQRKVIEAVHAFGKNIPEVKHASVGRTDGVGGAFSDTSYDVCFILSFEDEAARLRYNENPVHLKAAQEVFLPLSRKLLFYRFAGE
ncbi:MAG: Dabb family protein [Verrucomicrobia bacterium]|nr:Dabb family protein [Verrucomicrobiota bacterium]